MGKWLVLFVCFAFVVGCASEKKVTKEKETIQTTEDKLISTSHEKPPDWLYKEPEADKENLYFVGISDKAALEQSGRTNALDNARQNVVKYLGSFYQEKLKEMPDAAFYWYYLADAQIKAEQPREALVSTSKGLEIKKQNPDA